MGDLSSTSLKFLYRREIFCQFPSMFRDARRPSVSFYEISLLPGDITSISVNFLSDSGTFCELCQLPMWPGDVLSNSVDILCGRQTFRHIPSTFCAARRNFINFCQLSVLPEDFRSTFCVSGRTFINFRQLSLLPEDFGSAFRVSGRTSVTFRQFSRKSTGGTES